MRFGMDEYLEKTRASRMTPNMQHAKHSLKFPLYRLGEQRGQGVFEDGGKGRRLGSSGVYVASISLPQGCYHVEGWILV